MEFLSLFETVQVQTTAYGSFYSTFVKAETYPRKTY